MALVAQRRTDTACGASLLWLAHTTHLSNNGRLAHQNLLLICDRDAQYRVFAAWK